jgi:hypothetical protein
MFGKREEINNLKQSNMVIQIEIPLNIINICKECGWDEQETKEHFATYMSEVINHPYGHFEQDFGMWLEDLVEQE